MTSKLLLIIIVFLCSCSSGGWNGEWGATTTNNDEFDTIYNVVQHKIFETENLIFKNFPDQDLRKKHIKVIENGHQVESWFYRVSEAGDTLKTTFTCEVFYSQTQHGYIVKNLKFNTHDDIIIGDIQVMPDDVEGCACYLSRSDQLFEQASHLFASNNDSIAYVMINNQLNKIRMVDSNQEPFTFKNSDLVELYKNEQYDVTINAIFEDSTSFESWMFRGVMTVKNKAKVQKSVDFVGACGC